ncbi:MAG: nitrate reductase molybdenum cofactor assembly chaperone [Woeseia sp.]
MSSKQRQQILKDVYALIAELWCSPYEADATWDDIRKHAEEVVKRLESISKESAKLLSTFLRQNAIAEEDYIDLFELDPQCALYLGSHSYDEPKTCAGSAVSDRNEYMIELTGIYKHFGQLPNGKELPDYLPLMVDFLSLTAESKDDPVREKLIKDYFLPYLPPMRSRLEELRTPYLYLLDALEKIVSMESKTEPLPKQREEKVRANVG